MEDISKINLNDVEYKVTDTEVRKRYPTLDELPTINGVEVVGNLSLASLGIQPKGEYAKYVDLPFKLSDLANDMQFQTATQVQDLIQDELANFEHTEYRIVSTVPTPAQAETGIIYLVANGSGGYDEYVKVGDQVVSLGNTGQIDLSNYYNKTETDTKLATKANLADIPLRTQQLTNDSGFVTDNTTGLRYYMKTTDINNALNQKADKTSVPTKVSQLTNDSGYITKNVNDLTNYTQTTELNTALNLKADKTTTYTKTEVDTALNLKADKNDVNTALDSKLDADCITDDGETLSIITSNNDATYTFKQIVYGMEFHSGVSGDTVHLIDKNYVDTKADISDVPTKTSDLTNDSGFIDKNVNTLTSYYTKTQTDTLLSAKEDVANKKTSITASSTDTDYPSAKAVWTLFKSIEDVNGEGF